MVKKKHTDRTQQQNISLQVIVVVLLLCYCLIIIINIIIFIILRKIKYNKIIIIMIATHPECCDLCYHAWYLDDGVLAGPSSHVRKALALLIELGPLLGLRVNIRKCEVFSSGSLTHFPVEMKQSSDPNLDIPIGDAEFCSAVLDRKRSEARFLLKRLEDVG